MQQQILDTIDLQELGQKLQRIRKRRGITQATAAELLGVARTTITAIEKGERRIKADELRMLAEAYGQSVGNFLSGRPIIEPPAVLFRSDWSKAKTSEALQSINQSVEQLVELATNYYELEQLTDSIRPNFFLPSYRSNGIASIEQEAESLAISERNRLGLADRPLPPLRSLLESEVGLRIFYLPLHKSNKFSEIYFYDQTLGGCIALNQNHASSVGRCRWSLAHAYAHFLAHRHDPVAFAEGSNGRKPESEHFADSFAAYFLMPTSSLTQRFTEIYQAKGKVTPPDLVRMANDYGVSFRAIVLRLEEMKLVPRGLHDRLVNNHKYQPDKARVELGLSECPEKAKILSERYIELAMQAYADGKITESQFAKFLQVDRLDARDKFYEWDERAEQTGRNIDVLKLKAA